jgi:NAD(P)-dependent dehydrogenase (short-subunit alcohol dehydrogenase family)
MIEHPFVSEIQRMMGHVDQHRLSQCTKDAESTYSRRFMRRITSLLKRITEVAFPIGGNCLMPSTSSMSLQRNNVSKSVIVNWAGSIAHQILKEASHASYMQERNAMLKDLSKQQDPRSQYPGPPSRVEIQPAPATQAAMSERPDCGETSYRGSGRLVGRRALLTGADSGIGRAAAIAYAREGADVAINYLPAEQQDAEEVAQYIREAGRVAVLLPGDISSERFCEELVTNAVSKLGGLDVLVNNAGRMGKTEGLLDTSTERFDLLMKTNIYSIFWITKAAVPHLKPGSSIINTTSIQGFEPSGNIFDYAITKAAIANFTKGLSDELMSKYGIRINAIAPGPIWAPLQEADGDEDKLKKLGSKTPYRRPGQPIELAPVYVLLASQEASYVTGEIYGVTGGMGIV